MDMMTKASRLKEYIRDAEPSRATVGAGIFPFLIKARMEGDTFPIYWFEVADYETPEDESLAFAFYAQTSDESGVEPIGEGKLISAGDGFRIAGLAITQPLNEVLSPAETGAMLLERLDELMGLPTEEATWKLTGRTPDSL
jgi:hypothetical protein